MVEGRIDEIDEEVPHRQVITIGDDSGTLLLKLTGAPGTRQQFEVGQLLRVTGVAQRSEETADSSAEFVMVDPTWRRVRERSDRAEDSSGSE